MLSRLDDVIYPNRCEVIEIEASQRYIYPIFKNASSSINEWARQQNYKILFNEQIKRAPTIDVVLRDPQKRFTSGVNTFVQNLLKDEPTLSKDTILYFVENYLFLNRHYAPQLSWLINLFRYTTKDTKFHIVGMESVPNYTPLLIKPNETNTLDQDVIDRLQTNIHNQYYLKLELALMALIGNTWTSKQVFTHLMNREPQAFFETIGKSNTLIGVTDVLS